MRVWECQTRRCAAPTDRLDVGAAVGGIRTSATLSCCRDTVTTEGELTNLPHHTTEIGTHSLSAAIGAQYIPQIQLRARDVLQGY